MKHFCCLVLLLTLCLCVLLSACEGGTSPLDTGSTDEGTGAESGTESGTQPAAPENPDSDYVIHSFYELNRGNAELDSHTDPTAFSSLEMDYRSLNSLDVKLLKSTTAYYPRLKRMADGKYILFFQEDEHGNTVWYTRSADLVHWDPITPLFSYEKDRDVIYATGDAVILSDGSILAVCSYRQGSDYDLHPERNGIVMRKSTDNGNTWSDQKIIYVGTTWEPYPMQLRSGEIQVYFTNTTCYYRTPVADASTGTAMFRSFDGGMTWNTDITRPYSAQIVSQTATRVSAGQQLFSDQMPVCVELHNGTMFLALETRIKEGGTTNTYGITLSRSSDNWAKALGTNEAGPADKVSRGFTGAAPYVVQFPSGEVIVAYTRQGELAYRMADPSGKLLSQEDRKAFDGLAGSYWGALELIDAHTLIGIGDSGKQITVTRNERSFGYAKLNLNHTITASNATVVPDGDASEWKETDDALFLGAKSQAQVSVRCAADADNLFFLFERLDTQLEKDGDTVSVFIGNKENGEYDRLTVDPTGVLSFEHFNGKNFTKIDLAGIRYGVKCNGTVGYDGDEDVGYSVEIAVPKKLLSFPDSGEYALYLILNNIDGGQKYDKDVAAGSEITNKKTWFSVKY